MGCLQGRVENETFIVLDAFALPVEGTETRVTALDEGMEYMVQYATSGAEVNFTQRILLC